MKIDILSSFGVVITLVCPFDETSLRKPVNAKIYSVNEAFAARANMRIDPDNVLETQIINGLEITLKRVWIDSTEQSVCLALDIVNPNHKAWITMRHATLLEREGDQYECATPGSFFYDTLDTGETREVLINIVGVPQGTRYFRQFRFTIYNPNTQQELIADFKNITVGGSVGE